MGFLNKCSFFVCRACAAPAPTKGRLSSEERERGRRLHGQAPPRGSARLPNLNVIFTPVRMKGARGVSHFDGAVSEKVAGMAPPPSGRPACVRCGLQSGWLLPAVMQSVPRGVNFSWPHPYSDNQPAAAAGIAGREECVDGG